jgi:putative PIN family toxin of toxin-antitoxin system
LVSSPGQAGGGAINAAWLWSWLSKVVDLAETIPVICRDPDDDRLIACAVVGEADLIASGDGDLLALE